MAEQPLRPSVSHQLSSNTSIGNSNTTSNANSMNLRHRGPVRLSTSAESTSSLQNQRRNSSFSDTVSEARNSIRSSTDDLFFPKASRDNNNDNTISNSTNEDSPWHSAPLVLALLPAVAEVFFHNGSAFITDVTLLVLAAIFLNWSVRLPWDWYQSAQAIRQQQQDSKCYETNNYNNDSDNGKDNENYIPPEAQTDDNQTASVYGENSNSLAESKEQQEKSIAAKEASEELQVHELAALASCFIFPVIGTWLLHTIRSSLSRPSEGLVSNYNLTIFLLASEVRPCAHLLRMIRARTLYLQRIVTSSSSSSSSSSSTNDDDKIDASKIQDLSKRLEELQAHVAEAAAARVDSPNQNHNQPSMSMPLSPMQQDNLTLLIPQVTAEIRKSFQPKIDALNRAVRRYEKRTTLINYQTETRLQELETQVRDAVALVAAAQKGSGVERRHGLAFKLLVWMYEAMMAPIQILISLARLPVHMALWTLEFLKPILLSNRKSAKPSTKYNQGQNSSVGRPQKGTQKKARQFED